MITIINYGLGNLGSVQNMLKRIGAPCKITSDLKLQKVVDMISLEIVLNNLIVSNLPYSEFRL